jgi:hypothetical protein
MADQTPSVTPEVASAPPPAQVDPTATRPQSFERASVGAQAHGYAASKPYSVYVDPAERKAAEARERAVDAARENATGDHYEFLGHEDPMNGTQTLVTVNGTVHVGGTIQFTPELLDRHKALGFRFRKVQDEKDNQAEKKAAKK